MVGLLIERPDTIAGLGLRLEEQHPSAGWGRNIVHNTVPSLDRQGLTRIARKGHEPALSVLEPTEDGLIWFRGWFNERSVGLPALRDGLRARLRYVEDEAQLDVLLRDIDEQQRLCAREGEQAKERFRRERIAVVSTRPESELQARVRRALMIDEAVFWISRARELSKLAARLRDGAGDELSDPG